MTILKPEDIPISEFILRTSPRHHFENCVKIFNRANELILPKCNLLQLKMSAVYEECMRRKIPCRMLVLKPRQVGCSTFAAEILYHHCQNHPTRAVQIADELAHSDNIFRILCQHAKNDVFPWPERPKITGSKMEFLNGSIVEKDTAQSPRAGISATRQAIHASEVAKWASAGVRSGYEVMGAMLNSLADVPYSVAIAESTPNGTAGWFYEQWQGAVTLKDFLKEKTGNGWIKVFVPWFHFSEHSLLRVYDVGIEGTLDEREERGRKLYQWSMEQIAWRRRVRDEKCSGSERIFDEYYPEDDVSCFITSGSPRFEVEALHQLEVLAKQHPPRAGVLHESGSDKVVFEETLSNEAWVQIWEAPMDGCRYLIAADLSVGVGQASGEKADLDRHSVLVLKEAYMDASSLEHPHMLAARVKPPSRVEFDLLAWQTDLLSKFYGRCRVAPEMNNSGMAFIERLKERAVPLYKRQKIKSNGKLERFDGWQTTMPNRKLILDELATQLREGIDIRCLHLIDELKTFINHPSGKEQAMGGCHDDDVMALAIGLHCLPTGMVYQRLDLIKQEPKDGYEPQRKRGTFNGKW